MSNRIITASPRKGNLPPPTQISRFKYRKNENLQANFVCDMLSLLLVTPLFRWQSQMSSTVHVYLVLCTCSYASFWKKFGAFCLLVIWGPLWWCDHHESWCVSQIIIMRLHRFIGWLLAQCRLLMMIDIWRRSTKNKQAKDSEYCNSRWMMMSSWKRKTRTAPTFSL